MSDLSCYVCHSSAVARHISAIHKPATDKARDAVPPHRDEKLYRLVEITLVEEHVHEHTVKESVRTKSEPHT